ncbi:MAG TPA: hypothetical protein VH598_14825, partial [Verrucomicrobiae bacterium]|nr:hypothetical protein [Verrucomicrobiae bacterium]
MELDVRSFNVSHFELARIPATQKLPAFKRAKVSAPFEHSDFGHSFVIRISSLVVLLVLQIADSA